MYEQAWMFNIKRYIWKGRWKNIQGKRWRNVFVGTSVHTIMENVSYKRRWYEVTDECMTKTVHLLDDGLKISSLKKLQEMLPKK